MYVFEVFRYNFPVIWNSFMVLLAFTFLFRKFKQTFTYHVKRDSNDKTLNAHRPNSSPNYDVQKFEYRISPRNNGSYVPKEPDPNLEPSPKRSSSPESYSRKPFGGKEFYFEAVFLNKYFDTSGTFTLVLNKTRIGGIVRLAQTYFQTSDGRFYDMTHVAQTARFNWKSNFTIDFVLTDSETVYPLFDYNKLEWDLFWNVYNIQRISYRLHNVLKRNNVIESDLTTLDLKNLPSLNDSVDRNRSRKVETQENEGVPSPIEDNPDTNLGTSSEESETETVFSKHPELESKLREILIPDYAQKDILNDYDESNLAEKIHFKVLKNISRLAPGEYVYNYGTFRENFVMSFCVIADTFLFMPNLFEKHKREIDFSFLNRFFGKEDLRLMSFCAKARMKDYHKYKKIHREYIDRSLEPLLSIFADYSAELQACREIVFSRANAPDEVFQCIVDLIDKCDPESFNEILLTERYSLIDLIFKDSNLNSESIYKELVTISATL